MATHKYKSVEHLSSYNPFLERELVNAIRRDRIEDIEKIPELKGFLASMISQRAEQARLAESLNLLPAADLRKLFSDYIQEEFSAHLHVFFDKLYTNLLALMKNHMDARVASLEAMIIDMKNSLMMASLHPYAWVESEIYKHIIEYLKLQPGQKSGLYKMYKHLAHDVGVPLPGVDLNKKLSYILGIIRQIPDIIEWNGLIFELSDILVKEERATLASDETYQQSVLQPSLLRVGKTKKKVQ